MIIIQGIEHRFSVPPELDQLAGFQQPQLVADGALGNIQQLGQIAYAQLALKQRVQDLDAGGIPKHTEQLRKVIQNLVVRQIAAQPGNDIRLTVAVWVTYRNIRQGVG